MWTVLEEHPTSIFWGPAEDGGKMFLQNIDEDLPDYKMS
jgi:hypothetical protein